MSGLPERLEAAVDAMEGCSWLSPGAAAFILDRLKEAWPAILSELAAQQPEAPAAGGLPAEVEREIEALERAPDIRPFEDHPVAVARQEGHYEGRLYAVRRLRPLWPAPPPPAAWEAIETRVRDEGSEKR